ncbi:unnamed protein product [Caenorhabditis sp. 36 PRJEB53466]|nr:unnamed protein product [Caenorhabditis sp. 36 PRJEB53466]
MNSISGCSSIYEGVLSVLQRIQEYNHVLSIGQSFVFQQTNYTKFGYILINRFRNTLCMCTRQDYGL